MASRRVSQMNGQPLLFQSWTDFGQPGRQSVWGNHTSIGAALRMIFRYTIPRASARGSIQRFWVTDGRGRVVAGPYDTERRPSVSERAQP